MVFATPAKTSRNLREIFKQLNAPKGELGRASLRWSNRSVTDPDRVYARYLKQIGEITKQRDELARHIKTVLDNAAFHNRPVNENAEDGLGHRAKELIDQVKDLAEHEHDAPRTDLSNRPAAL